MKSKIIIITGPTATGKTAMGIEIAHKYKGEIISADSRQIYKNLENFASTASIQEQKNIKHHLISFLNPNEKFTSFNFKVEAEKLIDVLIQKNKIPIIVGGTGFYLESLIYEKRFSEVKPNLKLRNKLEKESLENLQKQLFLSDEARYQSIDLNNKRRIIRSIEIASQLGYVPEILKIKNKKYNILNICLKAPNSLIKERIEKRYQIREKLIIQEAKNFLANKIPKENLIEFGLGYKFILDYLDKKISKSELKIKLLKEEKQYAKKQKTFLKRFEFDEIFDIKENQKKDLEKTISKFLQN